MLSKRTLCFLSKYQRYTMFTFLCLIKLCLGASGGYLELEPLKTKVNDLDLFWQFKLWWGELSKQLINTQILGDDRDRKGGVTMEKLKGKYRFFLATEILPIIDDFEKAFGISTDTHETKKSKWRLLGSGIKLVIGISLLQAGVAWESLKEVGHALHGTTETCDGLAGIAPKRFIKKLKRKVKNIFRTKKQKYFKTLSGDDMEMIQDVLRCQHLQLDILGNQLQAANGELSRKQRIAINTLCCRICHIIPEGISKFQKARPTQSYQAKYNREASELLQKLAWPAGARHPSSKWHIPVDELKHKVRTLESQMVDFQSLKILVSELRKDVDILINRTFQDTEGDMELAVRRDMHDINHQNSI